MGLLISIITERQADEFTAVLEGLNLSTENV